MSPTPTLASNLWTDLSTTISYVSFDFHRETKGFNYSRISNLIDDIEPDLTEMRYVVVEKTFGSDICSLRTSGTGLFGQLPTRFSRPKPEFVASTASTRSM